MSKRLLIVLVNTPSGAPFVAAAVSCPSSVRVLCKRHRAACVVIVLCKCVFSITLLRAEGPPLSIDGVSGAPPSLTACGFSHQI